MGGGEAEGRGGQDWALFLAASRSGRPRSAAWISLSCVLWRREAMLSILQLEICRSEDRSSFQQCKARPGPRALSLCWPLQRTRTSTTSIAGPCNGLPTSTTSIAGPCNGLAPAQLALLALATDSHQHN